MHVHYVGTKYLTSAIGVRSHVKDFIYQTMKCAIIVVRLELE